MNRIKQLDSLRAIAVVLVIIHHLPSNASYSFLDNYPLGANLFFVLSGYLITSILLHEKEKARVLGTSHFTLLKNFAAKRALRIFPLYFLVVGFVCWYYKTPTGFNLTLGTFTFNFYVFFQHDWNFIAHIWSLSVQEHFYFLWPLVVLFASRKGLLPLIVFFIATGIIFQLFLAPGEFGMVLTPSCFDALGAGALLAWIYTYHFDRFSIVYRWLGITAGCSLLLVVVYHIADVSLPLPFRTLYAVMVMWIIAYVIYNRDAGLLNHRYLLGNPVLQFIGRISFGLYLLHPILPDLTYVPLDKINRMVLPSEWYVSKSRVLLLEDQLVLVVAAWLCYRFVELPFLRLKKYFVQRGPVQQPKEIQPQNLPMLEADTAVVNEIQLEKG